MTDLSATELAKKIKAGEILSSAVVAEHIKKIENLNPKLNAMVENCFEAAREKAMLIDELVKTQSSQIQSQRFLGVPFTMKEMIAVSGMMSTLGSIHRKNSISSRDATVVERLRSEGGVLLGTGNVPEVGLWFECWNKVYGKTSNPYDFSRTSGGSTGGDAAMVAAGLSNFSVGSDIGGSIRIPAAFCGIFGHKPTHALIPFTGHSPMSAENAQNFAGKSYPLTVIGPIARKSEDLWTLMRALIGGDGIDPVVAKDIELKDKVKDWSQVKVFVLPSPKIKVTSTTETDLAEAVDEAGKYFKSLGANVSELPEDIFDKSFEYWTAAASVIEQPSFNSYLSPENEIAYLREFALAPLTLGHYTLPALLIAFLEKHVSAQKDWTQTLKNLAALRSSLKETLGENGILLMPVHPRKAPRHYSTLLRPFDFAYTGIINALRWPASSAPLGLSNSGLPLSVQIVAGMNQDHLCLSACEAIEKGFGGWTPPTGSAK